MEFVTPYLLLTHDPLDPEDLRKRVEDDSRGGVVMFCGEVRATTDGVTTDRLVYEAYSEMALKQMERIAEEASARWSANIAVAHRLGDVLPGEIAVVCIAACPHRAEAFECCRFLIDRIKADVPLWKADG